MSESKESIRTTEEVKIIETKNSIEYIIPWNANLVERIKDIDFKPHAVHIRVMKKQVGFRKLIEKKDDITINFN